MVLVLSPNLAVLLSLWPRLPCHPDQNKNKAKPRPLALYQLRDWLVCSAEILMNVLSPVTVIIIKSQHVTHGKCSTLRM